jgi:hypothetical protein
MACGLLSEIDVRSKTARPNATAAPLSVRGSAQSYSVEARTSPGVAQASGALCRRGRGERVNCDRAGGRRSGSGLSASAPRAGTTATWTASGGVANGKSGLLRRQSLQPLRRAGRERVGLQGAEPGREVPVLDRRQARVIEEDDLVLQQGRLDVGERVVIPRGVRCRRSRRACRWSV